MKTVIMYEPSDITTIRVLIHDSIIQLENVDNSFSISNSVQKLKDALLILNGGNNDL